MEGLFIAYVRCLECIQCKEQYSPSVYYTCPKCANILDVKYDYDTIASRIDLRKQSYQNRSLWRYSDLLPINDKKNIVSLNEGDTPLHKCVRLGNKVGLKNLFIKDETRNPTGSFKDRPITVAITKAREFNVQTVTSSSSGNAGVSLAAYAAKAGLNCIIFAPADTPKTKLMLVNTFGSKVITVRGSLSDAYHLAEKSSRRYSWFNATSTFLNPYSVEGDKTVAYELYTNLNGETPDWVYVPIGAGPLLVGCWKGFKELELLSYSTKLPHMVGIQAEGCAPIVKAFKEKTVTVSAWEKSFTIASAIADPLIGYTQDGTYTLSKIRESNGSAEACSDKDILESVALLAQKEGIFAEPAGASSLAGALKMFEEGKIDSNEIVVCLVTGTGLKQIIPDSTNKSIVIDPDFTKFTQLIDRGLIE